MHSRRLGIGLFFFNDTATTEIYTLSLHDALPILQPRRRDERVLRVSALEVPGRGLRSRPTDRAAPRRVRRGPPDPLRSEEHTSELQSRQYLVCRLLLEKK